MNSGKALPFDEHVAMFVVLLLAQIDLVEGRHGGHDGASYSAGMLLVFGAF